MCPRRELNPYRPYGPQDFKSCVSTSSTTGAMVITKELSIYPKRELNPSFLIAHPDLIGTCLPLRFDRSTGAMVITKELSIYPKRELNPSFLIAHPDLIGTCLPVPPPGRGLTTKDLTFVVPRLKLLYRGSN